MRSEQGTRSRPLIAGIAGGVLLLGVLGGGCSDDEPTARPTSTTSATSGRPRTTVTFPSSVPDGPAGTLPDLTGDTFATAVEELGKLGIRQVQAVDATGEDRLIDVGGAWSVASQSIPPRSNVDRAAQITLFVVGKGEKAKSPDRLDFIQVPDLLSTPVGAGVTALVDLGLNDVVINDFSGNNRPVPPDDTWTILSQRPTGGAWVKAGTPVKLTALPAAEVSAPVPPGAGD